MLTAKQIEARQTGVGGSEIAAIMGFHPFMTPFDVWADKVGFERPEQRAELDKRVEIVHFGNLLEDVIAQEYARRTGRTIRKENRTLHHDKHPFILGHIDRRILGEKRALECKNVNQWSHRMTWGDEGTDEVPDYYAIQCQQYNLLMNAPVTDLAACVGGNSLKIYYIEAHRELQQLMVEAANDFWHNHVLKGEPPEFKEQSDIDTYFALADGQTVMADEGVIQMIEQWRMMKSIVRDTEKGLADIKKSISAYIGGGDGLPNVISEEGKMALVNPAGDTLATWNPQTRRSLSTKEFKLQDPEGYGQLMETYPQEKTFRVLLVKKPKQEG